MARRHDTRPQIAIVGGSAAGLFTAYQLARAGADARLFEGKDRLDSAPRTLIVTDRMRDVLGSLGEKSVVNEIRRFELFTDGRVARIGFRRPDLVVERSILIQELAKNAQQAGARIEFGQKFQSLEGRGNALRLTLDRTRGGSADAQFGTVVGADGAVSRVAQAAGFVKPRTAPLVQAIVDLPKAMTPDTVRVWFIPDDTPYFYWLIPHSPTQGVAGLIAEEEGTKAVLERFWRSTVLSRAAPGGSISPFIPVGPRSAASCRVATSWWVTLPPVKVTTVGGIVTGFRCWPWLKLSSTAVPAAILRSAAGVEHSPADPQADSRFHPGALLALWSICLNSRALGTEDHTRDEPLGVLWRLCLHQPRLILLGLRALISGRFFLRPFR